MPGPSDSLEPSDRNVRTARRRLGWRHELLLVLLPTVTVLAVVALAIGAGYAAAATAMIATIALMVLLDAVHPPAVATALSFAFRAGPDSNLLLFALAVGLVALLVALERSSLWLIARAHLRPANTETTTQ